MICSRASRTGLSLAGLACSSTSTNFRRKLYLSFIPTYKSPLITPTSPASPSSSLPSNRRHSSCATVNQTSLAGGKFVLPFTLSLSSSGGPSVMNMAVSKIDSNLTLWKADGESGTASGDSSAKKLVVLFSYMLSKERHIEKYRHIYHKHGFDVLTITTTPVQFFFPAFGAQKVAYKLLSYLDANVTKYPSMLVHAFSVGGYQYSELLSHIKSRTGDLKSDPVASSIKATIFDSPCDVDSVPYGLSHTVAGDTVFAKIFQFLLILTRLIFYPVSTKYHSNGMQVFSNTPLLCPSLFFASETDKMANIKVIRSVIDIWTKKGVEVDLVCWENTKHVSHYHAHPTEYVNTVEKFLRKVRLIS